MAKIIKREWTTRGPLGKRVRHVAYGYTLMVNGQRERKVCSDWLNEADAHDALSRRLKEVDAGQLSRSKDGTLRELAEDYLKYKTETGKRSLHEDRRILFTRILPALGETLRVRRLTEAMIANYEKQRISVVSPYTVGNEMAIFKHMLRLGRKWGYLERVPDIDMPKKPEGRLRFLSEEEIGRLLQACAQSRNPYLLCCVILAIHTGMRKSEILNLEWERIDVRADFGFSARITLHKTKSGRPRGIPLNKSAVEALTALEPDVASRTGYVFKKRNGAFWGQMRTAFETAVRKACLPDFRFHDLRHTAASHMIMRGRSLKEVQEILGHGDFKMTLRYAHLSPAHLRTAVEALDGLTATPQALDSMAHKMAQSAESSTISASVPT